MSNKENKKRDIQNKAVTPTPTVGKKRKKKKSLAAKNAIAGYLFIIPFLIGFIFFMVFPLFESLRMSFSEVKTGQSIQSVQVPEEGDDTGKGISEEPADAEGDEASQGVGDVPTNEISEEPSGKAVEETSRDTKNSKTGLTMKWVKFKNYNKAFKVDKDFVRLLVEEIQRMLLDLPATLIFSFFIALLLNQTFRGRGLMRAIFFLPVILSSGVIVGLEFNNTLLQGMKDVIAETSNTASITGVLEDILVTDGMGAGVFKYIFDLINHVYDIAIASGIQIIIFLSALQTISTSMFEAAKIEGCTAWECFWKITLPMVSSMILVNVVYTIVDFFVRSDNRVMTKISDTMIALIDYGFSSAMAWIYFVICMAIIGLLSAIISKRVYYYE